MDTLTTCLFLNWLEVKVDWARNLTILGWNYRKNAFTYPYFGSSQKTQTILTMNYQKHVSFKDKFEKREWFLLKQNIVYRTYFMWLLVFYFYN